MYEVRVFIRDLSLPGTSESNIPRLDPKCESAQTEVSDTGKEVWSDGN